MHTVEVTAANKWTSTSCPSYCGRKTRLFLAMQVTPVMSTNRDFGSWEYAGVQDKRKPGQNLSGSQKKRNRKHSSIRARVEHVLQVIKRQFELTRSRYRGLMKIAVQVNMLMGLANLYLLRREMLAT
ncbi:MAG: transposase [Nitrosomonas sp.]|nr:transposase [Nitrosomonas sp.]